MTPENLLRAMCERHGLPLEYGRRLLPLVRRAMEAPDEVRERILALVDGNLANRVGDGEQGTDPFVAERERSPASGGAPLAASPDGADVDAALDPVRRDADHDILIAVARVLHGWSPSASMSDFGTSLGGLGAAQSDEP
jgi:hypothetical protein